MKKGFPGSYMYHPPDVIISFSNVFQVKAAHYHPRPFWLVITERKAVETTKGWMAEWSMPCHGPARTSHLSALLMSLGEFCTVVLARRFRI
jgi:hypothetical protein